MKRRIYELREVERIMGMLEGEIRFRKNPLRQSFMNISMRCGGLYGEWMNYLARLMEGTCEEVSNGFMDIWQQGLNWLSNQSGRSCIKRDDIDGLYFIGQALTEGDTDTQINALALEKTVLENRITELSNEVRGKSKIAFSLCGLGGILMVICLAL